MNSMMALIQDLAPSKVEIENLLESAYLPRLQLCIANSTLCKQKKVPVDNYALVTSSTVHILGETVDVVPILYRPTAMDTNNENLVISHDVESAEFKRIRTAALEPDSGMVWGPEFLVWLPDLEKFATLMLGSKSAKRSADVISDSKGSVVRLGVSDLIKKGRNSWRTITATPIEIEFIPPTEKEFKPVTEMFLNDPGLNVSAPALTGSREV